MNEREIHTYYIKNMLTDCCKHLINIVLTQNGYEIIELVSSKISFYKENFVEEEFCSILNKYGFSIIKDKDLQKVELIKQAVIELVHYSNNVDSIIRKSEYLVERLGMQYQQISRLFSKYEHITLERYILLQKMERVKELLLQNEFTLSEIAYFMDFSSVHHLSATFKKICGVTVSEYKKNPDKYKKSIDTII